ncbi:hypothetical protein TNCV_107371 [Trichonephila clavipes]|nr:hypothetical protein TNCV_107371 [Trichonephila clavipes]
MVEVITNGAGLYLPPFENRGPHRTNRSMMHMSKRPRGILSTTSEQLGAIGNKVVRVVRSTEVLLMDVMSPSYQKKC